jgi:putative transcriptional regulator
MPAARDRSIEGVEGLLQRAGFYVTDAHHIRPTSFDLMARRDSQLVIIKVLKNIDALDPGEAGRLAELQGLFHASVLIVGETSGAAKLEPGVVYNRYGLPIVAPETLEEYLLEGVPPFLFSSPGGVFARIDGDRLKEQREERGLSLGALASVAGVSRRTIQLYEEGGGAEVEIVQRLEAFLRAAIALPLPLFLNPPPAEPTAREGDRSGSERASQGEESERAAEAPSPTERRRVPSTGDSLRDNVFFHLNNTGWEVVVTVRCPFDAFTQRPGSPEEEEILLTSVGSLRSAQHRAEVLLGLARVAEGHAMFVVRESQRRTSVDGLPLVSVPELRRHRGPDELLDLIQEREQP